MLPDRKMRARLSFRAKRPLLLRWLVGLALAVAIAVIALAVAAINGGLPGLSLPAAPSQPAAGPPGAATLAGAAAATPLRLALGATATVPATLAVRPPGQAQQTPDASETGLPTTPTFTTAAPSPTLTTLPPVGHDLLYLNGGRLVRLSLDGGQQETLAGPADGSGGAGAILFASPSANRLRIALLRSEGVSANGVELEEVGLYQIEGGRYTRLITQTSNIDSLLLSPDGRWVAYRQGQAALGFMAVEGPGGASVSAACQPACAGLAWSPDSSGLLWGDAAGVWLIEPGESPARRILEPLLPVTNPEGVVEPVKVSYEAFEWSPQGRYALAQAVAGAAQIRWTVVIDTRTDRVSALPGSSSEDGAPVMLAGWSADGRIRLARGAAEPDGLLTLSAWQVVQTRQDLLLLEKEFTLSRRQLSQAAGEVISLDRPASFDQVNERLVSLLLLPAGQEAARLLQADWASGAIHTLTALPAGVEAFAWTPDRRGALLYGPDLGYWYYQASGGQAYPLPIPPDTGWVYWLLGG